MSQPTASNGARQLHAELCSALGDANRLLLLYTLAGRPRTVSDLAVVAGLGQSTASRQLKVLREHGLVEAKRQGPHVEYRLTDVRIIQALDLLRLVLRQTHARRAGWLSPSLPTPNTLETLS